MSQKYLRKCLTSLAISEMQIKMTLRFNLTHVIMAKIKTTSDSLCWQGCGARGTVLQCQGECKLVEINMWIPQKTGNRSSSRQFYHSLSGIYPTNMPTYHKETCAHRWYKQQAKIEGNMNQCLSCFSCVCSCRSIFGFLTVGILMHLCVHICVHFHLSFHLGQPLEAQQFCVLGVTQAFRVMYKHLQMHLL